MMRGFALVMALCWVPPMTRHAVVHAANALNYVTSYVAIECVQSQYESFQILHDGGLSCAANASWFPSYVTDAMLIVSEGCGTSPNSTCCFDSQDSCNEFALEWNMRGQTELFMGQYQIENASSRTAVTYASRCQEDQYLISFPSINYNSSNLISASNVPGVCATVRNCADFDQYQTRAPLCCSFDKYSAWLSESEHLPLSATEVCGEAVPCSQNTTYLRVEYELQITNAECTNITMCKQQEYQITSATATTDAVCSNTTICDPYTQYPVTNPTYTTDRICRNTEGPIECISALPSVFVNASAKIHSTVLTCLKAARASSWGYDIPPCSIFNGSLLTQETTSGPNTACCFASDSECSHAAVVINEKRTTPCSFGQYMTQPATSSTLGHCMPHCTIDQYIVRFASKKATIPEAGECKDFTECQSNQYIIKQPLCVSNVSLLDWQNNFTGGSVAASKFGKYVPCDETLDHRSYETYAGTGIKIYATDLQCANVTVCNSNDQYLASPATTTTDAVCVSKYSGDATNPYPFIIVFVLLFVVGGNGWLMKNYLLRGEWFAHSPKINRILSVQLDCDAGYSVDYFPKTALREMSRLLLTEIELRLEGAGVAVNDGSLAVVSVSAESCITVEIAVYCYTKKEGGGMHSNSVDLHDLRDPLRKSSVDAAALNTLVESLVHDPVEVEVDAYIAHTRSGTCFFERGGWSLRAIAFELFVTLTSFLPGVNVWLSKEFGHVNLRNKELAQEVSEQMKEVDEQRMEIVRMRQAWEIHICDITKHKLLASGAFGDVYSGTWGHIPVALKFLRTILAKMDPLALADFRKEAQMMQSIRHPNLVVFFGMGKTHEGQSFMVFELMEKGSLRAILRSSDELQWPLKIQFVKDITKGMVHLHGLGLLHRDLKSDNVLISFDMHAKVADFGQSTLMFAYKSYFNQNTQATAITQSTEFTSSLSNFATSPAEKSLTAGVGTPLWCAPELLIGDREYDQKVDVYSFGIVMWEIVTRQTPWEELDAKNYIEFVEALQQAVLSGRRPKVPDDLTIPDDFRALMTRCWGMSPSDRPPFTEVWACARTW